MAESRHSACTPCWRVWGGWAAGVCALSALMGAVGLAAGGCTPLVRVDVRGDAVSSEGDLAALGELSPLEGAWQKADVWPRRWGVPRGGATRYGVITKIKGPIAPLRHGDESSKKVEEEMVQDIRTLLDARRSPSWRDSVTAVAEGRGSFVYQYERPLEERVDPPPTAAAFFLKFISGTRVREAGEAASAADGQGPAGRGRGARGREYRVQMQRTWIGYYPPVVTVGSAPAGASDGVTTQTTPPTSSTSSAPAPLPTPRALVVVLPGIFGTPATLVDQCVSTLRARGYGVVRLLAHPSRFTERVLFDYTGTSDEEFDAFAKRIAAELGDRVAECAYAIEDAVERIARERPETEGLSRIALGMSGGAMVLPTVVAKNPEPYTAAVLIAGGVDFCRVAVESNYAPWIDAVTIRWQGKPLTKDQSRRLSDAYSRHAPLDSRFTISALAEKPVLMLQALGDEAVPAELGDEMWLRAGRPDRWVFDTGHELLFAALSGHLGAIADWIDNAVPRGVEWSPAP
ncbi:MAG: alpha/beta hydrolase family protein [Phycisphaerales bacterium]